MNKEEIIAELVNLDIEELEDIEKSIYNLKGIINKSEKDNLFIRYLAFRGYHSMTQFYDKNKETKDTKVGRALKEENDSLSGYVELKNILNIPDDLFMEYIKSRIGGEDNE